MKKLPGLILITALLLSACSPSESAVQTAIANTQLAIPTNTAIPPDTATPTATPTETPLPTNTPTITRMPTLAFEVRQTMTAMVATDTATPTPKPTRAPYERTATAQAATQTYLDKFKAVEGRDFLTYPDKYKSEFIRVEGRIFNINRNSEFQIFFKNTYDPVYIWSAKDFDNLYKDDYVIVYGNGMGEHCGKNAFGGEVCQPIVMAVHIEKR